MCWQSLPEWKQGVATNLAAIGQWLEKKWIFAKLLS